MSKPARLLLLALAYWGAALMLLGLITVFLGDCGSAPSPQDDAACVAQKQWVARIGLAAALLGFAFFLWRMRKEKGPL